MSTLDASPPEVPGHRLERIIGAGGTSVVWAGVDRAGVAVAVKVPRPGSDWDPSGWAVERQVLSAVRHEHLVPLRDVVELSDGRTALVFDLVTGAVLRSMVHARGQLRPGEVVTILTPICQAVAALHAAGGSHGDISAGNIMLTSAGRPLLLDLGAARVMGYGGQVCGTEGFIAPEVREGATPTTASDVFSLGAVAWFCLTGYGAPDTVQRLDLDTVRSHVGDELAEVIAASIDPDPGRRPEAARLARLLYDAVQPEPVEVVVGADDASALTHRLRADAAREEPAPEVVRRPLRLRVLAAVVALLIVGAGAWLLLGRSPAAVAGGGHAEAAPVDESTSSPTSAQRSAPTPRAAPTTQAAPTTPVAALVQHDGSAPRTRPTELMQWLSDQRAGILVARDLHGLDAVHRPGSGSHQSDVELIETLLRGGNRYADLHLTVAESASAGGGTERATIRARVNWSAYDVVDRSGVRRTHPAAQGELLDFDLIRGADGWRIEGISAAGSD
ncbi:MAG TPA: serine/threonine-protein kinase [Intrasporangium sp.]|nr:serine/threonine-protein kinase [Intrasporangium sp.]